MAQCSAIRRRVRPALGPLTGEENGIDISPVVVGLAGLATAAATGLGALPLLAAPALSRRSLARANAAAAGIMLAASHGLLEEGMGQSPQRTLLGLLAGVVLVAVGQSWTQRMDLSVGDLRGADARRIVLIVAIMTVHSFAEGIGVGVAFAGREALAWYVAIAIAVQNVPEGLAISLVLVPRGVSVPAAAGWSVVSSLPQPLMALPAFGAVSVFQPLLPAGLGLAAGAMIWMVFADLFPDAVEEARPETAATLTVLAFCAMLAFQRLVLEGT